MLFRSFNGLLTTYSIPTGYRIGTVAVDKEQNIWFTETNDVYAKLGRVSLDDKLTEWIIPNQRNEVKSMTVDDNGNVFFQLNYLYRFVPSTETFTRFDEGGCDIDIIADHSGKIYCDRYGVRDILQ